MARRTDEKNQAEPNRSNGRTTTTPTVVSLRTDERTNRLLFIL